MKQIKSITYKMEKETTYEVGVNGVEEIKDLGGETDNQIFWCYHVEFKDGSRVAIENIGTVVIFYPE